MPACRSQPSVGGAPGAPVPAAGGAGAAVPGAGELGAAGGSVPFQAVIAGLNTPIGPGDILRVTVFQEDDLKSLLRVSQEGDITFPLIGVVPVKGLSTSAAAEAIAARLRRGYLIDPQVNVTVMEFAPQRFTVLGQVQRPGAYALPDQESVTLLQAIGMAGGYTNLANPKKVTLMRRKGGHERTYRLDAARMAGGDAESSFEIQPGDVITVGENLF
jgi:protein involved in polysaccharide export with SLBB domain